MFTRKSVLLVAEARKWCVSLYCKDYNGSIIWTAISDRIEVSGVREVSGITKWAPIKDTTLRCIFQGLF